MTRKTSTRLAILAVVLTGAYLIGITFDITPWLRGPDEWRWAYVVPGNFSRIWLPALVLTSYLIFVLWLQPKIPARQRVVATLLVASFFTIVIQLGLLYLEHADVRSQLFYRTVSPLSGGFFNVGATVTDISDFLSSYAEHMAGFPVHPQRHPPGLTILFALTRNFFDHQLQLAQQISATLRPYQCQNLTLMNLPDSAIASATLQMLLPVWLSLIVWPIYYLGRKVYNENTGLRAALLWPVIPSVALWATRWNHLYALLTLLAYSCLYIGLRRRNILFFFFCGLLLSVATLLSFGNVVLAGFLGIYVLIWYLVQENRPSLVWLSAGAGIFLTGAVLLWVLLWLGFDFDPVATWQNGLSTHLSLGRSYATWLFYHLFDFLVFLGIPISIVWAASTFKAFQGIKRGAIDIFSISLLIGLLLLDVSGTSQGEVARVWAFLLPLFLLVASQYMAGRSHHLFTTVVVLLVLQVFISNIYLRPVGTGLLDPPAGPPDVTLDNAEPLGAWQEGPLLLSAELPKKVALGQPLQVEMVWSTSQQIHRPYTIFVHLLDDDRQLVAQQDRMPLQGEWLTTCWSTGEGFSDTYEILLPDTVEPGSYHVLVGLYWLPSGERLGLIYPGGQGENSLDLGQVLLEAE